jgi:hypothetical protein
MTTRAHTAPTRPGRCTQRRKAASTDPRHTGTRPGPSPKPATISAPPSDARAGAGNESGHRQSAVTPAQAIRELADRAHRGSEQALAHLRRLLDNCPEIWEQVGDLARHAELAWLDLLAGEDRLMHEAVKRQILKVKGDLLGTHPTPMERLLVDQAVACYLAVQHAEMALAAPGSTSPAQAAIRLRRAESSQKRYLAALKTLARLRATVPQGLAPLHPLQLRTGDRQHA